MRYIANIVTKQKIDISPFFKIASVFDDIEKDIPTLIIGWNYVKEMFPEQDILNHKISDMISWTFSKREKRYQYEKDIVDFFYKVTIDMNRRVNYRFFNYLLATKNKRLNFISYINKGNCSLYYNSKFLYIYNSSDSITIGLSLKDLSYIGINIKDFIFSLNIKGNNLICNDLSIIDADSLFLIKDNIKVVPYLNYLKNSDIYKETEDNHDKDNL